MHDVSALWQQIYEQVDHRKEIAVTVNVVEYYEDRILNTAPSVSGKLFDAPSVGNARSRTLTLNLMPYDGPQGYISPMAEIRLYVRLKSADGQSVSEWIPKGVFYADEVKRDSDTGATRITAFDAIMKMERQFGNAVCRITFDDSFGGIQRFIRQIGDAMPTPDTPTHTGERFIAWYPNPADTETVVRDMLFTAEWARKFTVTFDSGSGTPQTFSVFSGDATPTPTTPTKEGYTFTGWTPTLAATVTADALYFAQWEAVTLQSVAITAYPAKTAYNIGDTLDYTGLEVTASYSDSTTQDVTAECVLSPADGTTVATSGTIAVTVAYGGETVGTFNVTAETVTVQSLIITSYPTKTAYTVGETLDYEGLEVTAYFSNGDEEDVTADCTLSPVEGAEITATGTITVTASYEGVTATFDVTAEAAQTDEPPAFIREAGYPVIWWSWPADSEWNPGYYYTERISGGNYRAFNQHGYYFQTEGNFEISCAINHDAYDDSAEAVFNIGSDSASFTLIEYFAFNGALTASGLEGLRNVTEEYYSASGRYYQSYDIDGNPITADSWEGLSVTDKAYCVQRTSSLGFRSPPTTATIRTRNMPITSET